MTVWYKDLKFTHYQLEGSLCVNTFLTPLSTTASYSVAGAIHTVYVLCTLHVEDQMLAITCLTKFKMEKN
jgi:hypothetical protein